MRERYRTIRGVTMPAARDRSLVTGPAGRAGRQSDRALAARQPTGSVTRARCSTRRRSRTGSSPPSRKARPIERVREAIDDDGARVVIYMGGDGTFAEVAKGILAVQPRGRGRDGHAADRHRERSGQVVRARLPAPGRSSATSRSSPRATRSAATSRSSRSSAASKRSTATCSSTRSRSASARRASPRATAIASASAASPASA